MARGAIRNSTSVPGADLRQGYLDHHGPRAISQNLADTRLAPVAAVRRDRLPFGPNQVAPDPARKAKAIAADAAQARLIMVRRAQPCACGCNYIVGIREDHSTIPWLASPLEA